VCVVQHKVNGDMFIHAKKENINVYSTD